MKRFIGILLVMTFALAAVPALAAGNTVAAIGTGSVTLQPDMASFNAGITSQDTLVTTAQTANTTAMQAVIDALLALDVQREDLQTSSYAVYPIYDYQSSTPTVTGYEVSNTVTVTVRDLAQLPSLLDAAVEAGANNVYSLGFQSSQSASAYDQALKAAAQDALRKAALMAQAIGKEAGAALSLEELSSANIYSADSRLYAMESSYAAIPVENGMLTITAQVQAVVELQ